MRKFLLACAAALAFWPLHADAKVLDIQDMTTPSGIRVWLVRDPSLPVMALDFAFRNGAAGVPAGKQGVTQLLSNTLDEGAGDMKSQAFQDALRDNAIGLSFTAGRDNFSGDLRTLDSHRDEAVKLMKMALAQPRFDADALDRMKQANLARIRSSLGDPDWIAARILYSRIYKGHPYALSTGGTLATMGKLTAADVQAERARLFARDTLVVGIAGNIDAVQAGKMVDDMFAALPAKTSAKPLPRVDMPVAGKPVFYAREMPQTVLTMAWAGIGVHDPDYYAMLVADYIFGGGSFSSRLMTEVREKRGLTYGIDSSPLLLDHADRYTVSASMLPANVKPTIDMVKAIATAMKTTDVSADELQGAKDYLTGSLPLGLSSTARIASTLVAMQLNDRPVTALDDYRVKINAVTPADIRRVAGRLFAADPVIVLVGAKPDGMDVDTITVVPDAEGGTK